MVLAETKINFLRTVTIGLCFALHTLAYYTDWPFATTLNANNESESILIGVALHQTVTLLALAWVLQSFLIHLLLATGYSAFWIGPRAVIMDAIWLTSAIGLTHGPGSGLVSVYFVIIATAAWRLHLHCVWVATSASLIGYFIVLGIARFSDGIIQAGSIIAVPRHHQGFVVVALLVTGWIAAQTVRAAYTRIVMSPSEPNSPSNSESQISSELPNSPDSPDSPPDRVAARGA